MADTPSTRDQLILAALHLMDAGGHEAVTLRAVAQAVGVSHNAPYRHFRDKQALLIAVAEYSFGQLADEFASVGQQGEKAIDVLLAISTLFIAFARSHPARYQLLFQDLEIGRAEGPLEMAALSSFAAVRQYVETAQTQGDLPDVPSEHLTAILFSATHGMINLELSGRARTENGLKAIDALPQMLLDLLRPRG